MVLNRLYMLQQCNSTSISFGKLLAPLFACDCSTDLEIDPSRILKDAEKEKGRIKKTEGHQLVVLVDWSASRTLHETWTRRTLESNHW
jgi:hypothetical protein